VSLDRRGRWWVAGGVAFVLFVAIAGIWRELDRDVGNTVFVPGFDVELTDADRSGVALMEGDDWVFEQSTYETVDANGRPAADVPCFRLRIGDRATGCLPVDYDDGSSSVGAVRAPDGRGFVQVFGGPSLGQIRIFTSAGDELLAPLVLDLPASGAVAIAELEPAEEPYGVQVFGADGELASITSLVGWLD
jgi:hypothetical protein